MSDTPEALARMFHETYERLAPEFGYQANMTTRLFNPQSPNGQLMMATCADMRDKLVDAEITRLRAELAELRERLESARESMVESAVHEFSYGTQLDKLRAQVAALEAEVERRKKDCNVLIDHIDDHDRECAGKWVRLDDRLPGDGWVGDVCYEDRARTFEVVHEKDGVFYYVGNKIYGQPVPRPVWWREDRLPGRGQ